MDSAAASQEQLSVVGHYLASKGWKYSLHPDRRYISLQIATETYRNPKGESHLTVAITTSASSLTLAAPTAFKAQGPHRHAVVELIGRINYAQDVCCLGYDHRDGEVLARSHIPFLMDAVNGEKIERLIYTMAAMIEACAMAVAVAASTGVVDLPDALRPDQHQLLSREQAQALSELSPNLLRQLAALAPDDLRSLGRSVEQHRELPSGCGSSAATTPPGYL